jgi:ribosomal protein L3
MKEKKRNVLMIRKKAGMTQPDDTVGVLVPVTIVEMCRKFVANVKTIDSSGYSAVQFGFFGENTKEIDEKRNSFLCQIKGA